MGHYKSNVRDLEFTLFDVLGLGSILESGAFGDLDEQSVRSMLEEAARLAEGPLAASYSDADRNPPTFDVQSHSVLLPESIKQSLREWQKAGWFRVGLPEGIGGVPAPAMLAWAINEFSLGANPAAHMYLTGPFMAGILYELGTEQQRHWATLAIDRNWGATMVLTEPDAGSDVGAGRTKAVAQPDGTWHLEGVKRFITSGDSDDLFDNILHFVLARPEGAGGGTKGLSLFLVPKFVLDPVTGESIERNGVYVTNVERKMGLKASATCELTFGADSPAKGWLVGDNHAGIAQMFKVIEEARMMVGTKAIATLSSGYLNALEYAKTRVQGSDLSRSAERNPPKVTITHHPDVRRSLMAQKCYAEGLRAVYLYTAAHQDPVSAHNVSGIDDDVAFRVNDLLLPVVKGVGSERAYQYLTETLQCFGGSGFLQDYPIEQYVRDAKIDSLYEGTTAIQAQDFFFRKIARDRGVGLGHVLNEVRKTAEKSLDGTDELGRERALLGAALTDIEAMTAKMTQYLLSAQDEPRELHKVGLGSVRFLLAFGDLIIGWRLLVAAEVAIAALAGDCREQDRPFYLGKVAAASFFAKSMLPLLNGVAQTVNDLDLELMDLDESVF